MQDFVVDPRHQELEDMECVLAWEVKRNLLRSSVMFLITIECNGFRSN